MITKNKKKINKIKKLTLLSPYTTFDTRKENSIDIIFKDIRIYKNCNTLKELNLQFQFYDIKYIKNLISTNLISLSIGDLDIISFDKIMGIICKNQSLNSLKLSFFSADVSYFTITLLKVYEQIKKMKRLKGM